MLSIEECREKIENDEEYTDEEMEEIRDQIYELADLAIDTVDYGKSDNLS